MNKAVVYLVGAGPGDPGLITVRGRELLGLADAVVYDFLANPAFLSAARGNSELIYVGKQGGAHTLPQKEINQLLINLAKSGKTVVRLKGGDPFIFGRGGEEAQALAEAGIPFEIVPGVTSGSAAAAYAGIPVTHRGLSSSVAFITGHETPGKQSSDHNWQALAHGPQTLVFYMGVHTLPDICRNLLEAGMPPERPAAVVERGTLAMQRTVTATLSELPQAAAKAAIAAPAVVIVGEVVNLRQCLHWYEKRPLFGRTVVVTRSREQAGALSAQLEALGAAVIEFPCIEIRPLPEQSLVQGAIERLKQYAWVVFTSANGVKFFWRQIQALGRDARVFASCRVAAMGPGTAEALQTRGIRPDFVPERYVAESMAEGLLALGVSGKKVLIPRAVAARDVLPQTLEKGGAEVKVLPVYEARPQARGKDELLLALQEDKIDWITFASSGTVHNFFAAVPPLVLQNIQKQGRGKALRFACIGPITRETLEQYGFSCDLEPEAYSLSGLVSVICDYYNNRQEER